MLRIDAKIADQLEVTFIRAADGLQTQERINGRQALSAAFYALDYKQPAA